MPGYFTEEYARSLVDIGEPLALPRSGSWILVRRLPGSHFLDATGCYPVFNCLDWNGLSEDLKNLPSDIVALSLVTDSASDFAEDSLQSLFTDVCYHYKNHYFSDLRHPLETFVSSHHQRNARLASKSLRIEPISNPIAYLQSWEVMYEELTARHDIQGSAAFSSDSFARQMRVPGLRAFGAFLGDEIVGMQLWMVHENTAYYHLAAYSEVGYQHKASFALFWHCLEIFSAEGMTRAALGGGAGTFTASHGLNRFKQGWSSEVRPSYLCGRILNRNQYAILVARTGTGSSTYFPAYRTPALVKAA